MYVRQVATISFWPDRHSALAAIHFDIVAIIVARCLYCLQSLNLFYCSSDRCCDLLQSSASAFEWQTVILAGVARRGMFHRVICLALDSF